MSCKISILSIACFLTACKSYDLKPAGERVKALVGSYTLEASIKQNAGKSDSPFSKCKFLGGVESGSGEPEDSKVNDIRNQSGLLGANTVFIGASGNSLLGSAYHCASIETLVTLQERLDAEEKKKKEIENEKKVAELFSKPHYWLICGKSPYSQALPSMTIAALRNFKPKGFDKKDSGKCADGICGKKCSMDIQCGDFKCENEVCTKELAHGIKECSMDIQCGTGKKCSPKGYCGKKCSMDIQ